MQKKKSKQRILDQIIIVESVILLLLFVILVKGKHKATNEDSPKEPGTVTIAPQSGLTSPNTPTMAITPSAAPTAEPTVTIEPNDTPLSPDSNIQSNEGDTTGTVTITPTEGNKVDGSTTQGSTAPDSTAQGTQPMQQSASSDIDGVIDSAFIQSLSAPQSGTLLQVSGQPDFIYYMQTDSRWASKFYGDKDTIGEYGCGPTSLAMVISNMTDIKIDPVQMCEWAFKNDYWFPQSGSLHTLIPNGAEKFGLKAQGVDKTTGSADKVKAALQNGKMVIVLMGKGTFTNSGHFVVLRGITDDDKVYVADPADETNTNQTWDLNVIVSEAKSWAAANGPFWIISK